MLKVYYISESAKYKQVVNYLNHQSLEYRVINLDTEIFSYEDFLKILSATDYGSFDLIKEKCFSEVEDMKISEMYKFICENPKVLSVPIIMDYEKHKLLTSNSLYGFMDDLGKFTSRKKRKEIFEFCQRNIYENEDEDLIVSLL